MHSFDIDMLAERSDFHRPSMIDRRDNRFEYKEQKQSSKYEGHIITREQPKCAMMTCYDGLM